MSAVAMKDSGAEWLGEIPSHWNVVHLSHVAEYINGAIFKPSDWSDVGLPIIRIQNLTGATDKFNYFEGDKPEQYRIRKGDMLISWSASIGVFVWHGEEAWLNQHIFKVGRLADSLSKEFFLFSLRHSINAIKAQTHGSTMKHIVRNDFLRTKMTLPPLHEQRAIASYLDTETAKIDRLIAKTEQLNALLREKRVALISQAVTKGLDAGAEMKESGVEWLGEIPRGWDVKRLKYLATVRTSNVDKKSVATECEVSLLNYTDVYYNEYITDDIDFMQATATTKQIQLFELQRDDVVVTKDSETWDDIAVPTCVEKDLPGVVCAYHLALIRPIPGRTGGRYLSRSFASTPGAYQFKVGANGVTRFGLPQRVLRDALFPLPPLREQRAIADHLDRETARIDALISKNVDLIALLREKRTALISAAVTGKIAVPPPQTPPP